MASIDDVIGVINYSNVRLGEAMDLLMQATTLIEEATGSYEGLSKTIVSADIASIRATNGKAKEKIEEAVYALGETNETSDKLKNKLMS